MSGKLFGILLMILAAMLAWKWLRGQNRPRPPARRPHDTPPAPDDRDENVIELEQGSDGVFRPKDKEDTKR